ncbi:MAG: nickel pincer cofactor biosynthesis protein LarC [Burkholderiaceae bacterium]|jgi:uncharacterized protein (TIGR00299 family) protein|nr:nickel pincer cofactor biosynthesis protein LarC [Burkholderiaceae bacterium]
MQDEPVLYLECRSGVSGDMLVAALLDLGVDRAFFSAALESLGLEDVHFSLSHVSKQGIRACDFAVVIPDAHTHADPPGHAHRETHDHPARNLSDINALIEKSALTDNAKRLAKKIFVILAETEARIHSKDVYDIHFHEVGAADSIMDVAGIAVCVDHLGVERVAVSPLTDGCGHVVCQHGRLPVPVPAVADMAVRYGLALHISDCPHELVTPTGMAALVALKTESAPPTGAIRQIGYGAGKRDLAHPNVLRAMMLSAPQVSAQSDTVWVLEANMDDATGEQLGLAMESLFRAGALDVHYTPVFMKKNRPGWLLRIIAQEALVPALEETAFLATTTIGIRRYRCERRILVRDIISVSLPYGTARVKRCRLDDRLFYHPEYESVKALSEKTGMDFVVLMDEIRKRAEEGNYHAHG